MDTPPPSPSSNLAAVGAASNITNVNYDKEGLTDMTRYGDGGLTDDTFDIIQFEVKSQQQSQLTIPINRQTDMATCTSNAI
mmetsp:Transcript_20716/g.45223  ORF Transcript_20716/g.45223 Transcript_20716/m.45223 type:complete len:81 (+) Transcript_20716:175-417(+)